MGLLENIQILQTLQWLDEQISKTNKAIGMGERDVAFDKRHYIYRNLKDRMLETYPAVTPVYRKVSGANDKELDEYLFDNNLVPMEEENES